MSSIILKLDSLIEFISTQDTKKEAQSWCIDPNKTKSEFRNFDENPRQKMVDLLYKNQHINMTYDIVMKKRNEHLKFNKCVMNVEDMLHYLNSIIDESDPDTDLTQMEHAIQTAESARKAYPGNKYDWLHVTCMIHDLGKILNVTDKKLGLTGIQSMHINIFYYICCIYTYVVLY